jgi:hypothetical protein
MTGNMPFMNLKEVVVFCRPLSDSISNYLLSKRGACSKPGGGATQIASQQKAPGSLSRGLRQFNPDNAVYTNTSLVSPRIIVTCPASSNCRTVSTSLMRTGPENSISSLSIVPTRSDMFHMMRSCISSLPPFRATARSLESTSRRII